MRIRVELEALYRKYFYDIHGFRPFPMQLRYENVIDFLEWLERIQEEQK